MLRFNIRIKGNDESSVVVGDSFELSQDDLLVITYRIQGKIIKYISTSAFKPLHTGSLRIWKTKLTCYGYADLSESAYEFIRVDE